jgi:formylglycine-generating enzyme required for sulfatase activity
MAADTAAPQDKPEKKYTETVKTKDGREISFDMVLIPGGSFLMGSPADEVGRKDDEGPQHEVSLDQFYLCTKETNLELFQAYYQETLTAKKDLIDVPQKKKKTSDDVDAITGPTPVYGDLSMGYEETHPAIGMTWHNAMTFCKWLSKKTGRKYRLPTEAEWEYACRAGTRNVYSFGDTAKQLEEFTRFNANSDGENFEAAQQKPNPWGIYDMSGNVYEWVFDFYSPIAYKEAAKNSPAINPKGPKTGKVHAARGGDYTSPIENLRCASRAFEEEWWRSGDPQLPKSKWWLPKMDFIGFRVARSIEADTKNKSDKLAFTSKENGEYVFDTGILRGKLRQEGKSMGLSSVVHIPSGVRLDGRSGIFSHYRIFTTNKRYGTAAWGWPSTSQLLPDGAVQITWPEEKDRPFEMTAIYRWSGSSTLELETTVKPRKDLSKFEVFLASYFHETFPSSYVYVAENPEGKGKPGFLMARKSFGNWQMFPRNHDDLRVIRDGRWQKKPNPVKWTIMPNMGMPIGLRRCTKTGPTVVLMAPQDDCFAISTPYEGEGHYSLYLSLFGCDIKAGETVKARSWLIVTTAISAREILGLYQKYIKNPADCAISTGP